MTYSAIRKYGKKRISQRKSVRYARRFRRKRAQMTRYKRMAIMGTGFPQKVMVKHRYVQQYPIVNSTPGSSSLYAIVANGMFAPTITLAAPGSHQPLYFDQYANIYDHYTVIASKCTFTIAGNTGGSTSAYTVCALVDDNSSLLSADSLHVAEQTQSRNLVTFSGNENDAKSFTLKFSAKRTYGGSILGNGELQGSATANPTETTNFALIISGPPGGTFNVLVTAQVEYIAIWRELREVSQS